MFILALKAAKSSSRSACDKGLGAMLTEPDRVFAVRQHESEHHLNPKHEGVEIPDNRQLMQKSDMIDWSDTSKSNHAMLSW